MVSRLWNDLSVVLFQLCFWDTHVPLSSPLDPCVSLWGTEWPKFKNHRHLKECFLGTGCYAKKKDKILIYAEHKIVEKENFSFLCYSFHWFMLCCILGFRNKTPFNPYRIASWTYLAAILQQISENSMNSFSGIGLKDLKKNNCVCLCI